MLSGLVVAVAYHWYWNHDNLVLQVLLLAVIDVVAVSPVGIAVNEIKVIHLRYECLLLLLRLVSVVLGQLQPQPHS